MVKGSVVLALIFSSVLAFAQSVLVSSDEIPGEVIVKLKHPLQHSGSKNFVDRLSGRGHIHHSVPGQHLHHLKLADGVDHRAFIAELNKDPGVVYAEPNYVVKLVQEPLNRVLSSDEVNALADSSQVASSYIQDSANVRVSQTWPLLANPANPVIVAVVDTGVDLHHYVLTGASALWSNKKEIAHNGIDDDGNGYIDDVQGWNFNSGGNNPMDDNGHGTHVAGIVIGVAQDIFQSTLGASKIQVMPLKFMDSTGTGSTAAAVSAIYYAVANGAKVINNSWGGPSYSQSLHDALSYAYATGVVISSAAGNYAANDDSTPLYPAILPVPSQLAVAATDDSDALASFSSYGPSTVPVGAPGVSILSTYPNNSFAYLSGTSMSAPFVSGLAAMAMIQAPRLTGYQIKNIIMQSSDPVAGLSGYVSTGARVDALSTVQNASINAGMAVGQPSYTATPPPGTDMGGGTTTSSSSGCGLVSSALGKKGKGGDGGMMLMCLLLLPILVWFVMRATVARPTNRRKHDRFLLDSEVRLQVDGRELVGKMSTISVGGVSFNAEALLEKGGVVKMSIASPDGGEEIQVVGQVVWSEKSGSYGVQFAPTKDGILEQIAEWTQSLVKT